LKQKNILSLDIEEIFHGTYTRKYKKSNSRYRTPKNIIPILKLLEDNNTYATFFILGEIAEKYPSVINKIIEKGHEVAFHGWSHKPLMELSEKQFTNEIKKFKKIYSKSIGFRAPEFSLNNSTIWALKILIKEKFIYDSSIFPTWTPLYGMYRAPIKPYNPSLVDLRYEENNNPLIEFPLATASIAGIKIPIAGGFWLRFLNNQFIRRGVDKLNSNGYPAIIYVHNWELDPETPVVTSRFTERIIKYHNIDKTKEKLITLLKDSSFTSFERYIEEGY
jgi:peptidoglycan-N-acetylglucosamine deacetylase